MARCVCAADYATNVANTNTCPAGYSKITDVPTCQAAAKALAKTYAGSINQTTFPSGCYLASSGVYFNPNTAGAANLGAQPLCKVTGAPPQTAVPRAPQGTPWAERPPGALQKRPVPRGYF